MNTLEQQIKQISVMIHALQANITLLLGMTSDDEVKRSIFLHCAMILFYQELETLLNSKKFITFFNENLTHLQDDESNSTCLKALDSRYTFDVPEHLSTNEILVMIQFSAVITSEAYKALIAYDEKGDKLRITGLKFLTGFVLGLLLLGISVLILSSVGIQLSLPALPGIIVASIAAGLLLILGVAVIYDRRYRPYAHNYLALSNELVPLQNDKSLSSLSLSINNKIKDIYPQGELEAQDASILKTNEEPLVFAKMQQLFFKLPEELSITPEILNNARLES